MQEEIKQDSRRKILMAAIVEFGEKGYEAASTNQICRQAEISKGLLFHYYKSKQALFAEALEQCLQDVQSAFCSISEPEASLTGRVQALCRDQMDFFAAHFHHFMMLEEVLSDNREPVLPMVRQLRKRADALRSERYRRFLDQCPLRPEFDREIALELLLGVSEQIQRKCLRRIHLLGEPVPRALEDFRKEYCTAVSMLFYGMLVPQNCSGQGGSHAESWN